MKLAHDAFARRLPAAGRTEVAILTAVTRRVTRSRSIVDGPVAGQTTGQPATARAARESSASTTPRWRRQRSWCYAPPPPDATTATRARRRPPRPSASRHPLHLDRHRGDRRTLDASILTSAPVCRLRPVRAPRLATEKVPKAGARHLVAQRACADRRAHVAPTSRRYSLPFRPTATRRYRTWRSGSDARRDSQRRAAGQRQVGRAHVVAGRARLTRRDCVADG
jgi:hypothetical protein